MHEIRNLDYYCILTIFIYHLRSFCSFTSFPRARVGGRTCRSTLGKQDRGVHRSQETWGQRWVLYCQHHVIDLQGLRTTSRLVIVGVTKVTGSFTFLDEVRGGSGLFVSGASLVGVGRVVPASATRGTCAGSNSGSTSSRAETSSTSIVASVFTERSNTFAGDSSVT
jgi:hypothetical protein